MSTKTLAVTGANGFLGRHCIRKAVESGVGVRGIVRRREAADLIEKLGAVSIVLRQLNLKELAEAMEGCYGVLHFVGIVSEQYGSLQEVNVNGTRLALDSAYACRASRFVVPTGLGVDQYGRRPWATNAYFASKRRIEEMCRSSPVPCVIFRPSYILGPGDELLPTVISSILEGKVLVAGEGSTPIQPVFVEDAAKAFLGAATGLGDGDSVYDLVGSETVTFMSLVPRVADMMRVEGFDVPDYEVVNIPLAEASDVMGLSREEIDVMQCDVVGDPKPFVRDFGVALAPLDEAIRSAVRAVRDEGGR